MIAKILKAIARVIVGAILAAGGGVFLFVNMDGGLMGMLWASRFFNYLESYHGFLRAPGFIIGYLGAFGGMLVCMGVAIFLIILGGAIGYKSFKPDFNVTKYMNLDELFHNLSVSSSKNHS